MRGIQPQLHALQLDNAPQPFLDGVPISQIDLIGQIFLWVIATALELVIGLAKPDSLATS